MRRLRAWSLRLIGMASARRRARRFDAELESHLDLHVEANIGSGMTPAEARRQALIALGGVQRTREAYRDHGGFPAIDSVAQDIRFAARVLRKAPGFAVASILILAIGIGANAAVFTLINALLIRPLNDGMLDTKLVGVYSGDRTRPDQYRMVQVLRQSGMLFEVSPLDPLTFTAAPLLMAAVTTLASYFPARRALRIDPAVALRPE